MIASLPSTDTVLVTGCAGFIGSHVVEELLRSHNAVVGVDNFSTGRMENLANVIEDSRFSIQRTDLTDTVAFRRVLEQVRPSAIIHLAALVSVPQADRDPDYNFRINIEATHVLAETAAKLGVRRIVMASSAAVYGDAHQGALHEDLMPCPLGRYGAAKLISEQILAVAARVGGASASCLRFFNVFGPRQDPSSPYSGVLSKFVDLGRQGKALTIFGDGEQTRDFVAVRDVARACVAAALESEARVEIANVCTGAEVSLNSIATMIQRLVPDLPAPVYLPARENDIKRSCGNPDRARTWWGFEAKAPEKALQDFLVGALGSSGSPNWCDRLHKDAA
ncbi:NAD-dependent epimerase/dehydratase family protein [Actomonas aquatica]|uniref:NAD-dependent epimerase/dehydratase family protein n=1 Tax=Actomonas aquatica TaxID=2866162 RepID=A0ABZ1CC99_9BACT|nr:NAD-dependent epimerase/dehydratase family protein [Opitutus sp. WL0086]WRQ89309.1 NAD-dependent epimerase/dehydratase family protein [Opitutus sp. WL0086]